MKSLEDYSKSERLYGAFTLKISDLIRSLLEENKINFHLIEHRTKTQLSVAEKIYRKNKNFDKNKEITDISGIRIITYYQKDVDKISKLIESQFYIDETNSINKSQILKNNEFGYQSIHYVIKVNSERENLIEWTSFRELKAEIQIRTVLQHAWASISHELQYKKSYEIPDQLKRKLFRLAGLVELADEQFGELKQNHWEIELEIKNSHDDSKDSITNQLNRITIDHFIRNSPLVEKISESAKNAGFDIDPIDSKFNEKHYGENISDILGILEENNINSIKELQGILEKLIENSQNYFSHILTNSVADSWSGSKDFFLQLILLTLEKDLNILEEKWQTSEVKNIKDAIQKYYS